MNRRDSYEKIAKDLSLKVSQIEAVHQLLEDGATLPFIARYRKEKTGSLDEVALEKIQTQLSQHEEFEARLQSILKSLKEREQWTDHLQKKMEDAKNIAELEDLYLPFRPKRKTKASMAREKGYGPLADEFFKGQDLTAPLRAFMAQDPSTLGEIWEGIRDIAAENISEIAPLRQRLRELFTQRGTLTCQLVKKKESEAIKFQDYFDYQELLTRMPAHRLHAVLRGKEEGFLRVELNPRVEEAYDCIGHHLRPQTLQKYKEMWTQVIEDSYARLLQPSLENEVLKEAKKKADLDAIEVFAGNVRELLLAAPLGQKNIIAIDPGFRTGCKAVRLGPQGQYEGYQTLFPFASATEKQKAEQWLRKQCEQPLHAIAIGNGTAGRETEAFAKALALSIPTIMVSESGASIYSASECARKEFPDLDLTLRGAISIGRRLQDPLAELVKLDPKSIGVGQYQHDVDQKQLLEKLDRVVESSVNAVGVELNSASVELLVRVSGLGPRLAESIVAYRQEFGPFTKRAELLKVPRLGAKAFEQAAGFLRIQEGVEVLDRSAVHPERYSLVKRMAKDQGVEVISLMKDGTLRSSIQLERYIEGDIGRPTLEDIISELAKPGRDPRPAFENFSFSEGINKPEDLSAGMVLSGIVTNVTKFGAFVDIGVHQDGLVHISQLADRFVSNPFEVVKVQQKVRVRVVEVDLARKRIGLSMKL